jgi:hypothetical protein
MGDLLKNEQGDLQMEYLYEEEALAPLSCSS